MASEERFEAATETEMEYDEDGEGDDTELAAQRSGGKEVSERGRGGAISLRGRRVHSST